MEPLIEAYLSGNEKRLRQLVLSGADVNRPMREYPGDILLEPCLAKNTRLVKFLLSHGARPTGKLLSDLIGYSGVLSVRYLARLLRRLLKAGAAPNAQERGHTLLWWAAESGEPRTRDNARLASVLLQFGADPNLRADPCKGDYNPQETPLLRAAYCNQTAMLIKLLKYGADINTVDNYGRNALFYAAMGMGRLPVYKCLVRHHIDLQHRLPDGTSITDYMRNLSPFVSGQADAYLIGCGAPRPTIPRAKLCPNL